MANLTYQTLYEDMQQNSLLPTFSGGVFLESSPDAFFVTYPTPGPFDPDLDYSVHGSGFTYAGGQPVSGQISGFEMFDGGFGETLTGASLDIATYFSYCNAHDLHGLDAVLLAGDDSIVGNNVDPAPGFWTGDALLGYAGNDVIDGLSGDDTLYGGDGNDTLDGGFGADLMAGDTGDDLYVVDNYADSVQENSFEGNDTVQASISFVLGDGVENLVLTGTQAIDGTGNEGFNFITGNDAANELSGLGAHDTLVGNGGDDSLHGGIGLDSLLGGDGNDLLDGGSDDDTLFGGYGFDTLLGGDGNDRMLGNTGSDLLDGGNGDDNERGGQGNDVVLGGTGDDSLYGDIARDTVMGGDGNDTLFGGQGRDTLNGEAGNDYLRGDIANDTLTGGTGADQFWFAQGGAGNADTVTDFTQGTDMLGFITTNFASLTGLGTGGGGTLNAANFASGAGLAAATSATDFVFYDTTSGQLWYDADGNGGGGALLVATLQGTPALAATDILVA